MAKADFAILCEDVRTEQSGKQIIIGVYTGDVLVQRFPANLGLVYWFHVSGLEAVSTTFELKVHNGDGVKFADMKGEFTRTDLNNTTGILVTPRIPVTFSSPGKLVLSVKLEDKDWVDIRSTAVILQKQIATGQINSPVDG